uniref:Secreted phosphoprotein 1 n=1 Tax=Amphilophus citrinellus TaxID=61819 RepID=A0A3Q0RJJ0_AMPCI
MKVALVFVLLFAAVLCRPVRRVCQIKSEFLPLLPLTALLPRLSLQETDEEEEEDSSDSSESGESSTPAPATIVPVVVTETPAPEPTDDTIVATIVTDTARGDNLGGHPSEYKSIVYVEEKSYHKAPGPYKSYEFVDTGKKTAYAMTDGNEVEKLPKVYKVQLAFNLVFLSTKICQKVQINGYLLTEIKLQTVVLYYYIFFKKENIIYIYSYKHTAVGGTHTPDTSCRATTFCCCFVKM